MCAACSSRPKPAAASAFSIVPPTLRGNIHRRRCDCGCARVPRGSQCTSINAAAAVRVCTCSCRCTLLHQRIKSMLWLCIRFPQLPREALAGQQGLAERNAPSERERLIQRAALERLAAWAYQWSGLISYAPEQPLLWLELGASCALFEGHAALLARIEAGLVQLGYTHVCALAPSPTAAALLT